jgi:Flp pilus assembly pilin Flp
MEELDANQYCFNGLGIAIYSPVSFNFSVEALMNSMFLQFWRDEEGQDLVEYSLLITFIAIATAALVGSGRPATNAIWSVSNAHITSANTIAAAGAAS